MNALVNVDCLFFNFFNLPLVNIQNIVVFCSLLFTHSYTFSRNQRDNCLRTYIRLRLNENLWYKIESNGKISVLIKMYIIQSRNEVLIMWSFFVLRTCKRVCSFQVGETEKRWTLLIITTNGMIVKIYARLVSLFFDSWDSNPRLMDQKQSLN